MNKRKLFIVLIVSLLCFSLSACGFVKYVEYVQEDTDHDKVQNALNEHLAKLQELSKEEYYREDELREYRLALLDAENELRECKSVSDIEKVFEKHTKIILAIPTDIQLVIQAISDDIYELSSKEKYRDKEQNAVDSLLNDYIDALLSATTKDEAEVILYKFKTELGAIPTDAQLTEKEVSLLREELKDKFAADINYAMYRTEQRNIIDSTIGSFNSSIEDASTEEECYSINNKFLSQLSNIPTDYELLASERKTWVNNWKEELISFARDNSIYIHDEIKSALSNINVASSVQEANIIGSDVIINSIRNSGNSSLISIYRDAVKLKMKNYLIKTDYRDVDWNKFNELLSDHIAEIDLCNSIKDINDNYDDFVNEAISIPTNDEKWAEERTEHFSELSNRYGTFTLTPPSNLTVAKSYSELAGIIDYYAFYQIDKDSFVTETFRVELKFPHKNAQWEINNVYWYCELIRSAVGLTAYFEEDSSQFVITLIPYDLASQSNTDEPVSVNRHSSVISFNSNTNNYTKRPSDFDDFEYLKLYSDRLEGIWSSQQLWYALEHEYIPIVVPNSPAERVLNRAKEILREIVTDEMSTEEKIFSIYRWYAENVKYDYDYEKYLYFEDRDIFPDKYPATLNSFHAEGALLDNLAVCCSYAKSYLILLRIEGIEAYRVMIHSYTDNAIGNLGRVGYGSHAIVAVRASDGKFYYSDVEQTFWGKNGFLQKYHQILVPKAIQDPYHDGYDCVWNYLNYCDELPNILDKIVYKEKSVLIETKDDLLWHLDEFSKETDTNLQLTLFDRGNVDFDIQETIALYDEYEVVVYNFGYLTEYMIYFANSQ